ncbi:MULTISPECIES: hypothetical protein [Rhizobium/Agrobacterium group]|jgi:hypothetical protein|uniref:hypothetical protein n=1 Tax=Rhizobium/Agrobacterium group TaxID=227290 RepID=UPI0003F21422|nr:MULTISPECIES: hypothetical protein [Rhizobium/Agrobacterium group]AHK02313.1 hypothetical protein X971_2447 [Agrobacterium tumefaciens LBA4213 (Ach5)]AKC08130.1 hypothetical protein Ach5_23550 [Agrobacterium tumefaciens]AYM16970.1 hypothetical protein At15955_19850 [Agrobacterium tumefaciens]AYM68271.1 hypothetical protein AtA6_20550 [Agrobacterium tumefaciens]NIB59363.1 hypothetical protein [Agrobacterium tumefaciens]
MMEQEYENWATTIAYSIVMHEGLDLALAAQNLDRGKTRNNRERLMEAIRKSLLEARSRSHLSVAQRL